MQFQRCRSGCPTHSTPPRQQQQQQLRRQPHRPAAAAAAPLLAQQQRRRSRAPAVRVRAMFTGIVQGMATVTQVREAPDGKFRSFRIAFPDGRADGVQVGASVAINGTCLTVTAIEGAVLSFDVMQETLRATSLGGLQEGARVNFERSARVGDEIGGHNVSGHVHTTATIVDVAATDNNRRVTFELPSDDDAGGGDAAGGSAGGGSRWAKYVLPKGFIALDGCSLTVGEVEGRRFTVYLIPETLRVTGFGSKGVGDAVNVEIEAQTQAIVDTVERVVGQYLGAAAAGGAGAAGGGGALAALLSKGPS